MTMRIGDEGSGGYSIDVSAGPDPACDGVVARVIVRQMPAMREVFRDEFASGGSSADHTRAALAAALARGQRFVRSQLCAPDPSSRRDVRTDPLR